jgi:hypothetical protein
LKPKVRLLIVKGCLNIIIIIIVINHEAI